MVPCTTVGSAQRKLRTTKPLPSNSSISAPSASLDFCTFRDLANPSIGGLCGTPEEFCRVSMQSRVVKIETAIAAMLQRYITLPLHFSALRPISVLSLALRDSLLATQKVQNSSLEVPRASR